MLENLTEREKWLIILAVIVLIAFLYYFQVRLPYQDDLEALEQEVDIRSTELERAKSVADRLPELEDRYDELIDEYEEVAERSKAEILHEFETVTERNNLEMVNFWPVENDDFMSFEMRIEGSYNNFIKMFDEVESWKSWLNFTDLQLNALEGGNVGAEITVVYPDEGADGGVSP